MPGGDSTGPAGQGPGIGRSNEHIERCRGSSTKASGGPDGLCVCPQCGLETPHQSGVPCTMLECGHCGSPMKRKMI